MSTTDFQSLPLQARIEAALAESLQLTDTSQPRLSVPNPSPSRFAIPAETAPHLLTLADTRYLLTDRAVRALGGPAFTVTLVANEIVIEKAVPQPKPMGLEAE